MRLNTCRTVAVATIAAGFLCASASADVLFDNTATDLNIRLNVAGGNNAANTEVGDEVILNGSSPSYFISSLAFQYWGSNLGLSANAEVKIYANDGALYGSSPTPGTVLFDSVFQVSDTTRSTLTFSVANGSFSGAGLLVPKDFTYTIRFTGLTPTGSAGVDLYNPPTVGQDFNDYWFLSGTGWQLRTDPSSPVNFAAQIQGTPVPEPATVALLALGGLALWFRRNAMQSK